MSKRGGIIAARCGSGVSVGASISEMVSEGLACNMHAATDVGLMSMDTDDSTENVHGGRIWTWALGVMMIVSRDGDNKDVTISNGGGSVRGSKGSDSGTHDAAGASGGNSRRP